MDKRIQKLQNYINEYLGKKDFEIIKELGAPMDGFDDNVLIYKKFNNIIFSDEITFFIEKGRVVDICISECFLWIGLRNIFYYKGETPEYKIINLIKKRKIFTK